MEDKFNDINKVKNGSEFFSDRFLGGMEYISN